MQLIYSIAQVMQELCRIGGCVKHSHVIWSTSNKYLPNDMRGSWSDLADIYSKHPDDFELVDGSKLYTDYRCDEEKPLILNELEAKYVEKCILELARDDRVASMVDPIKVSCFQSHVDLIIRGRFTDVKQGLSRLKSRVATLVGFKFEQREPNLWSKGFWAAELDSKSNLFKELKNSTIT